MSEPAKKKKKKGGAEYVREKNKRDWEKDANKCSKLTDLFRRSE